MKKIKKNIFIFFCFICLILSFYNFESRLTILTNSITLLVFVSWMYLSKIKFHHLFLILIIGYYSFIIFVKITCGIVLLDLNFFKTVCKLDSLYDRFSLALFSLTTWLTNPITFGLDLLNNFYVLNKHDLFLNNSYTSETLCDRYCSKKWKICCLAWWRNNFSTQFFYFYVGKL